MIIVFRTTSQSVCFLFVCLFSPYRKTLLALWNYCEAHFNAIIISIQWYQNNSNYTTIVLNLYYPLLWSPKVSAKILKYLNTHTKLIYSCKTDGFLPSWVTNGILNVNCKWCDTMQFAILIYLVSFKSSPHVLLAEISTGF